MAGKIRLGLVGAAVKGTWSPRAHFPALKVSRDFEVVAVCTTKAESAEAARQFHGAKLAFHDVNQMVASPEIDAVAVVVRVPAHYVPTKAALEAGKHVYCEWPLGRTTAEAEELTALARKKGLVTAVGLQARLSPTLMLMKEEIESGAIGRVMAVHLKLLREGVLTRTKDRTWQRDVSLGAHVLTIPGGHSIDAMTFVAGPIQSLSAVVETEQKQWFDVDNKVHVDVTAPDNVLLSGRMASGAVLSVHVGSIPYAGSGYRMEIYGDKGTLVVSGPDSPQMSELVLEGAKGGNALSPIPVPARLRIASEGTPAGPPYNVGQIYTQFAEAIRGGPRRQPTFETALALHRLIDRISEASKSGQVVKVA